jgi:hypothetical protein
MPSMLSARQVLAVAESSVMTTTAKLLDAVETIRPVLTEGAPRSEAERVPTSAGYQAM